MTAATAEIARTVVGIIGESIYIYSYFSLFFILMDLSFHIFLDLVRKHNLGLPVLVPSVSLIFRFLCFLLRPRLCQPLS